MQQFPSPPAEAKQGRALASILVLELTSMSAGFTPLGKMTIV
jgi:hypothetical protein